MFKPSVSWSKVLTGHLSSDLCLSRAAEPEIAIREIAAINSLLSTSFSSGRTCLKVSLRFVLQVLEFYVFDLLGIFLIVCMQLPSALDLPFTFLALPLLK